MLFFNVVHAVYFFAVVAVDVVDVIAIKITKLFLLSLLILHLLNNFFHFFGVKISNFASERFFFFKWKKLKVFFSSI